MTISSIQTISGTQTGQADTDLPPSFDSHPVMLPPPLPLNLLERLFVLSVDAAKGTISATIKGRLRAALVGALFYQIFIDRLVHLENGRLVISNNEVPQVDLVKGILFHIESEKKAQKINHWMEIYGKKPLINLLPDRLEQIGVINEKRHRYFLVVPYPAHAQVSASAKYWLKLALRQIVLADIPGSRADIILLGLLLECSLLDLVYTKEERAFVIKKVRSLIKANESIEIDGKLLVDLKVLDETFSTWLSR